MNYKIPDKISEACQRDKPKDEAEMELVKKEFIKFLGAYLSLKKGEDKGRNSLANITDIVSTSGEFTIKWTNYPFERDIAGRMMRTKNFTLQEGINDNGKKEVYVIAADRDWWDKYSGWVSIGLLIIGFILGIISDPIKERLFPKEKNKSNSDTISVNILQLPSQQEPKNDQNDVQYILGQPKKDSAIDK